MRLLCLRDTLSHNGPWDWHHDCYTCRKAGHLAAGVWMYIIAFDLLFEGTQGGYCRNFRDGSVDDGQPD